MRWSNASALLGALLLAGVASAQEPVRVYTNADLKPLPESSSPAPAAESRDDAGWEFVQAHLQREYDKIAADRNYDLDRAAVDASRRDRERSVYAVPYAPFFWGAHYPRHGRHPRQKPEHRSKAAIYRASTPRPIHAGPTRTQVFRARALQYRGVDAFPNR